MSSSLSVGEAGVKTPTSYIGGYEAARKVDPEFAEMYMRYTAVGDPEADAVVEELAAATTSPHEVHRIIGSALDHWDDLPTDTPEAVRRLVVSSSVLPEWFDRDLSALASNAFLRNSDMVLGGLIAGAIIEGFSTLISKSFRIRGRITLNGVRRLKQNLLQLLEQYLPGGIEPGGDGWKLSLRIRLAHAQARMLLKNSGEWDAGAHGLPLNASHMLLGAATFSGRLMQHVKRLGGDFNARERDAYVHVWRYTASIMGVPDSILFHDFKSAVRVFELAALCEPYPDDDAIIMANSIINSAPIVLGFTDPEERRSRAKFVYQVSRELIGNVQAEKLRFPPGRLHKELPYLQLRNFGDRVLRKVLPRVASRRSYLRFRDMISVSDLGQYEHTYSLPSSVFDEDSAAW